jgi:hypothetical protein
MAKRVAKMELYFGNLGRKELGVSSDKKYYAICELMAITSKN